jgi:small subunit ribosomal protein S9
VAEEQEQQEQPTPLIDPELVKDVIKPVSVSTPTAEKKEKHSAVDLGPKEYCWGTGRRKRAIARVRLRPGTGNMVINKRKFEEYFPNQRDQNDVRAPLERTENTTKYDVWVNVKGGGTTGQAGAVVLGIARALFQADSDTYDTLRAGGFLTRDSRKVERKKYGRRGARRSFQFSKR